MLNMNPKRLIVFDMDGVIVDVSRSYREAVRKTAGIFFAGAASSDALPDPMFPLDDLAAVKQSGGLNNDWDLTCCVIELLYLKVDCPDAQADNRRGGADPWDRFGSIRTEWDVGRLASYVSSHRLPLTTLLNDFGRIENPLVRSFYQGDVGSGNIIKQMFQEIYLGRDLFRSTYGITPKIHFGPGLIDNETLLLPSRFFEKLASEHILAIATGRPRNEAERPLDIFGIQSYFERVFTHDECVQAEEEIYQRNRRRISLGKPNPYMLDTIAGDLAGDFDTCFYVGDMPDDMVAAKRSRYGYAGMGVTFSAENKTALKAQLREAGADHVADDAEALMRFFQDENIF